jgi:hypothetical protein
VQYSVKKERENKTHKNKKIPKIYAFTYFFLFFHSNNCNCNKKPKTTTTEAATNKKRHPTRFYAKAIYLIDFFSKYIKSTSALKL